MTENNKLAVFSNPEFGEIRTLETDDGKVLFCGKDVAEALGYTNPSKALSDHCRWVTKCYVPHPQSPGKTIEMSFIPEADVYRLAFGSKLDSAEKFTDWVVEEVLPSIRKTGAYMVNTAPKKDDRELDAMLMDANARLLEAKAKQAAILLEFTKLNLSPEANQALVACASELMTGVKALPLPEVDKTYSAGEVGEMFGVSGNKIGRIANSEGLKTEKYGIFVLDKAKGSNKQVQTFRYNQTAIEFFRDYFGGEE